MRSLLGRFHRPFARSVDEQLLLLNNLGDGSTLSLDFTTGVLDPRLTFTRTTNATFINSQGLVEWAAANALSNSVFTGASGATGPSGWIVSFGGGTGSFTLNGTELTISNNGSATQSRIYQTGPTGNGLPVTVQLKVVANNTSGMSIAQLLAFSINGASSVVYKVNGTNQLSSFTGWVAGDTVTLTCIPTAGSAATCLFGLGVSGTVSTSASVTIKDVQIEPGSVARSYIPTTTSGAYQAPRFDYDPTTLQPRGLLIEGSANNLALNSNAMASGSYTAALGATKTATAGTAPDNSNDAARVTFTAQFSNLNQPISTTAGVTYTVSFWVKRESGNSNLSIYHQFSATGNSTAITVTTSWQRVFVAVLGRTGNGNIEFGIIDSNTSGWGSVLVWGFQVETGSGASSLIPTGASQGSRALDSCYIAGSNFTSWFSTGAGTVVAQSDNVCTVGQNTLCNFSDSTTNYYIRMGDGTGGGANEFLLTVVGGSNQGVVDSLFNPALNTAYKTAYAWDTNNFAICANGGAVATDTGGTLAGAGVITSVTIGGDYYQTSGPNSVNMKNGHIRSWKYYPTRLTNAQLQALTT